MKVLWFANTSCNADEYLNNQLKGTGGWLKALDREIQNYVDLHITFYSKEVTKPFKYKKTHYYPIFNNPPLSNKINKFLFNKTISNEHKNIYLEVIKRVNPDIIHIHGTENPFISLLSLTEVPIILSIQGNITICHHKYFNGIEKEYTHNNLLFNRYLRSYNLFNKMGIRERFFLQYCKYIIGRTDWDRRITQIFSYNRNYYHCDEILRETFYKNVWKPPKNKGLRLFTTTGIPLYKGIETICESLTLLQSIGIDIEWYVAGLEYNDSIIKIVKRKLKNKFPLNNLILLGNLSEEELVQELLKSDLYVMPSHIENSPNNLCEAMILGMPCIATYAGGTGSILTNNIDGVLIQDGDPWVLAGTIVEFLENHSKFVEFGENARKRALKRHNPNIICNCLIEIYKQILQ